MGSDCRRKLGGWLPDVSVSQTVAEGTAAGAAFAPGGPRLSQELFIPRAPERSARRATSAEASLGERGSVAHICLYIPVILAPDWQRTALLPASPLEDQLSAGATTGARRIYRDHKLVQVV